MSYRSLSQLIAAGIRARGPVSLHSFMRDALMHPETGYYVQREAIGAAGDFTTSPEISQVFGELLGVWTVHRLSAMPPRDYALVELGPGRGTLMADMLRVVRSFAGARRHLKEIHLVEGSPAMRRRQQLALTGDLSKVRSLFRLIRCARHSNAARPFIRICGQNATPDGIPIRWHGRLDDVPRMHAYYIAHEFFDALPTHRFQWQAGDEKEPASRHGGKDDALAIPSPSRSHWAEVLVDVVDHTAPIAADSPQFRLVLSKGPTLHSQTLSRFIDAEALMRAAGVDRLAQGMHVEFSPDAAVIAQSIGDRIAEMGGAALIIDYGENYPAQISLRAIREQRFLVDPLIDPGLADLSVDVDFNLIGRMLRGARHAVVPYGPLPQGDFLDALGIRERTQRLIDGLRGKNDALAKEIASATARLREKQQMGKKYKVMMAVRAGEEPPFPFVRAAK